MKNRIGKNEKATLDAIERLIGYKIERNFEIIGLGYFVDGYCRETNTSYEVDEKCHFDVHGNLRERDIQRQKEIENELSCKFVRIKDRR